MISEMRLLDWEFARRPVEATPVQRARWAIDTLEDNLSQAGRLDPETPAKIEAMIGREHLRLEIRALFAHFL